ncbi:MAG: hypothetical protein KY393_02655 [Actinobacteria bacterium]|nr:hypothetical protein [Actinomycetota bacterium]
MLHRRLGRVSTVLIAAMMLVMGACSNGNGDGGDNGSTSGDADSVRSSEGSVLTDSDCQRYAEAFGEMSTSGGAGNADQIREIADSFSRAADEVPNEMSEDFRTVGAAFGQFADALSEVDLDPNDPEALAEMTEEDMAKLQAAGRAMDDPAVQQAATNVTTFLEENCT